MSELCKRIKSILDDLWANPTIENADKLAAQIGEAEFANIIEHMEECSLCEKDFSDRLSPDSPDEKEGNFMVAFLALVAKFDKETEGERRAREEAWKKINEADREIVKAVYKFIEDRSTHLGPERWEISMERYSYAVFFLATDALSMLLGRIARGTIKDPDAAFALTQDGRIFHNGTECMPKESVRGEIARMIRSAQGESDELDLETAEKLYNWLFYALSCGCADIIFEYHYCGKPELLGEYPNSVAALMLAPTHKSGQDKNYLDGWK